MQNYEPHAFCDSLEKMDLHLVWYEATLQNNSNLATPLKILYKSYSNFVENAKNDRYEDFDNPDNLLLNRKEFLSFLVKIIQEKQGIKDTKLILRGSPKAIKVVGVYIPLKSNRSKTERKKLNGSPIEINSSSFDTTKDLTLKAPASKKNQV